MKRQSLATERTGMTRRFALPYQANDGLPPEIKEGLAHLKRLAEQEQAAGKLDPTVSHCVHSACAWLEGVIAPTPAVELMKIYFNVGLYEDGRPGEIFIKADRSGSLASGALDATATIMSIALQHGVDLHTLLDKLRHTRFEPNGYTRDAEFPYVTSALDALAQWLGKKFPRQE
jgi:hypothetical protein